MNLKEFCEKNGYSYGALRARRHRAAIRAAPLPPLVRSGNDILVGDEEALKRWLNAKLIRRSPGDPNSCR